MRLERHVGVMSNEDLKKAAVTIAELAVENDGMVGELRRKDLLIENHQGTIRQLSSIIDDKDRDLADMRREMAMQADIHRLEQENLALRADNALQATGQSQTPFLDGLARVGKGLIELDDRANRREREPPGQG